MLLLTRPLLLLPLQSCRASLPTLMDGCVPSVSPGPRRSPSTLPLHPAAGALVYAVTVITRRMDPLGEGWLPKDLNHVSSLLMP